MEKQPELVKITHIINPSKFFFRRLSKEQEELQQIKRIELKLEQLAAKAQASNRPYEPKPKDMVAYFHNQKWIRCEVDANENFYSGRTLILWACDYGIPLYTSDYSKIIPLESIHRSSPSPMIFEASLPVMPAGLRFDHINCKELTIFNEAWIDRAVNIFRELLVNTEKVMFFPSSNVSHHKVLIGDLLFVDQSMIRFGLCSKLIKAQLAVVVPDGEFLEYHEKLFTNIIERWNDNSRAGGVLKGPEGVRDEFVNLNFDIFNASDLDSTIDEDQTSWVYHKVLEWKKRCDSVASKEDPEESEVFDVPDVSSISERAPFRTIFKKPEKSKVAKADISVIETSLNTSEFGDSETTETVSNEKVLPFKPVFRSGPIFLAAGASIQSQLQHCQKKRSFQPISKDNTFASDFDDEPFESVSQLSANLTKIDFD